MSQAKVINLDSAALDAALEKFTVAAANKTAADKELITALDAVIEPVITSMITLHDCSPLNRFTKVVKDALPSKQSKICKAVEDYLINYIEIDPATLFYVQATHRFACNIKNLVAWSKDNNYKEKIVAMPLSAWLQAKKKKEKTARATLAAPSELVKKDASQLLKRIESYGLQVEDESWKTIYDLLKQLVK